jgi:hypothetical protein
VNEYKVIQWATGVVGTAAQDVEAILALEADCVLYCPLPWSLEEMCRFLEAGVHVITPCPYWFPFVQNPEVARTIQKSCEVGGVNFHASGCNPGGIAERFPLTFTGWCNRIDRITMTECGDCRTYSSEGVMRNLMNLGRTPEEADNNVLKEMLAKSWYEPIDMIAAGLGTRVTSYEAHTSTSARPRRGPRSSRSSSGTWTTTARPGSSARWTFRVSPAGASSSRGTSTSTSTSTFRRARPRTSAWPGACPPPPSTA